MGGLSTSRGKFNSTSGSVTLDREAGAGTIEVRIDATYAGRLAKFVDGVPTEVEGELTPKGVTKPVTLQIEHFLCTPQPMSGKEVCGADATPSFDRADFGIDYGRAYGLDMQRLLRIQVEAIRADDPGRGCARMLSRHGVSTERI